MEIDSNNTVIAKANLRFSGNTTEGALSQLFYQDKSMITNRLSTTNLNGLNSNNLASALIYRHLFKKKGRSFAASMGFNNDGSDGTENYFNLNQFFQASSL